MLKIGVLVAMEEELLPALELFGQEIQRDSYCNKPVYIFSFKEKIVYVVNSGVGIIAAAAATQMLIDRYNVDTIINFGFAGALKNSFKAGDLVVAGGVIHYDYDVTALNGGVRAKYSELPDRVIPVDKGLLSAASIAGGIKEVLVASGDKVIGDKNTVKSLIDQFNADICEMESAGIALTALRNGGVKVLLLKIISDCADENIEADFEVALKSGTAASVRLLLSLLDE